MIELARWAAGAGRPRDLAFLFFVREELPAEESALPRVFAEAPLVLESDLVVVLEPTDNAIHAGCLGNLDATLTFQGESAHSARPWQGVNAIDLAVEGLAPVVAVRAARGRGRRADLRRGAERDPDRGRIASNVVPDRVEVGLDFRYAPNRTRAEAEARLRELGRHGGRDHLQLPARSRRHRLATRPAPPRGWRSRGRAEAGMDAGRESSPARASTRSTSARGDALRAQSATSRSRSPSSSATFETLSGSQASVRPCSVSPSSPPRHLSVRQDRAGEAEGVPMPGSSSSTSVRAIRASRPTR